MSEFKIEAGTAQHIGNQPQQNDRVALMTGARAPGYVLALLSDGLTSTSGAEQVLHTGKQVFDLYKGSDHADLPRMEQMLRDIVHEAHMVMCMNAIASKTEAHASFVGLLISPHGEAVWAHVGDSRLYRFVSGECASRSSDAEYIDSLVADRLPIEAARNHRHSKLLINLLGNSRKEPFVTVASHTGLAPGDSFLLCSDGLWHFFTDKELGAAVHRKAPRAASERLIEKAAERSQEKGGNCSMAIIKLVARDAA
jgi:serine/threonine protein phosphatase PrpC